MYPGGDTVQDLQVHQGHAEHVLSQEGGVGMEGAEEGEIEYDQRYNIVCSMEGK